MAGQDIAIFDDRRCTLGEGALWHPQREQLFWFDIVSNRMLSRAGGTPLEWRFDQNVSAAGWIDRDHLLIAGERGLFRIDLRDGTQTEVAAIEAGNDRTRSNDGRADPFGGFWIGTMAKARGSVKGEGAIYRYYRGEVRRLYPGITVPNAICFSPDRRFAYFTDTDLGVINRQRLAAPDGWPDGAPERFLDLAAHGQIPDGAVVDADGNLAVALWGGGRVVRYSAEGRFLGETALPTAKTTCPALGGPSLGVLYCTSDSRGADAGDKMAGRTFAVPAPVRGLPEPRVVL